MNDAKVKQELSRIIHLLNRDSYRELVAYVDSLSPLDYMDKAGRRKLVLDFASDLYINQMIEEYKTK
jgi:hypothetical protein